MKKQDLLTLCSQCAVPVGNGDTVTELSKLLFRAKESGGDGVIERQKSAFSKCMINGWAMKTSRTSKAMSMENENEPFVLKHLPTFWKSNATDGSIISDIEEIGLVVKVYDPLHAMLGLQATSADGIGVRLFQNGDGQPFVLEMKCFSGDASLKKAENVCMQYGTLIEMNFTMKLVQKGDTKMLREVLHSRDYLIQVLNHALLFSKE